mgnify:CR=1 FL=1
MKKSILYITVLALFSCNKDTNEADAYGNFEATEITISSEASGKIEFLKLEEGDFLQENTLVGQIDTTQLYLNKQQLLASKNTIYSKSTNVLSQRNVLNEQLKTTLIEQNRIKNMFAEKVESNFGKVALDSRKTSGKKDFGKTLDALKNLKGDKKEE